MTSSQPQTPIEPKDPPIITDPEILHSLLVDTFNRSVAAQGEMLMPCVPVLHASHMKRILGIFDALGSEFNEDQLQQLGQIVARKLQEGFALSPHARLLLQYRPAEGKQEGLTFDMSVKVASFEDEYKDWVETEKPPLFGQYPDAKVMALASELGNPAASPILDIGAANGRNTLTLAQAGFPVDAVELDSDFVRQLEVRAQGQPVTVTEGDICDPLVRMAPNHYRFAIAPEVIAAHSYNSDRLRLFLVKMCDSLASGGLLLFTLFMAEEDYQPDPAIRQIAQLQWCPIFTRQELAEAMVDLPLELISDESVLDYEQLHRPSEIWPPSDRFTNWAGGWELFAHSEDKPFIELRWLVCRRRTFTYLSV